MPRTLPREIRRIDFGLAAQVRPALILSGVVAATSGQVAAHSADAALSRFAKPGSFATSPDMAACP